MRGLNKVILVGNIGNDIELKPLNNNSAVVNLNIATTDEWRDKTTQEKREKTEWHRVSLFGKVADIAASYAQKGSRVYIEGEQRTREWKDDNGQKRYTTYVHVEGFSGRFDILSNGKPKDGNAPSSPQSAPQYQEPPFDFDDDDIPF